MEIINTKSLFSWLADFTSEVTEEAAEGTEICFQTSSPSATSEVFLCFLCG